MNVRPEIYNGIRVARLACLFLIFFSFGAVTTIGAEESEGAGQEPADMEKVDEQDSRNPFQRLLPEAKLHGYSLSSYRGRWGDGEDDHDIYEYLTITIDDLIPNHVDAQLSGRFYEDLNDPGSPLSFDDDLFIDIDDTRDHQWPDRLSTGWIDIHDVFRDNTSLRIGRQYLYEFDGLHIDGAQASLNRVGKFDFKAFVGRPVTYYSGTHGDSTFGISTTYRPTKKTKFRAKYYRYTDDSRNLDDDQAEIEFWHREGRWGYFYGSLNSLDSDLKDLVLSSRLISERWNTYLVLRVYRLLSEIDQHSIEFSPFFAVLDELEPFSRSDIRLTKRFGDTFDLFGGVSVRREDSSTDDDGDVSNSDYERYEAGFTVYPNKKVTFTSTGQYWDVDSGRRFTGITTEVDYRPIDVLRLSAGNSYGEYRNEFFDAFRQLQFRERPDVLTFFGSLNWKVRKNTTFKTRLEIEDNDFEDDLIYRLQSSVSVRF